MASRRLIAVVALGLQGCSHTVAVERLETALAARDSATAALRDWCEWRGIAKPARIAARAVRGDDAPPPPSLAEELAVPAGEPTGYRHVRLSCGGAVLSEAHNWYVPARLTPEMNRLLTETDTPFGTVAAPLGYRRERLGSMRGQGPGCPAGTVLTHRARLVLPDGTPLALLVECYTLANLSQT